MKEILLTTYILNGGFYLAAILFLSHFKNRNAAISRDLSHLKLLLILIALVGAVLDGLKICFLSGGHSFLWLDLFFSPVAYFLQIYMGMSAFMTAIHFSKRLRKYRATIFAPYLTVVGLFLMACLTVAGEVPPLLADRSLEPTAYGNTLRLLSKGLYLIIYIEVIVSWGFTLWGYRVKRQQRGVHPLSVQVLNILTAFFFIYPVLKGVDLLFGSPATDLVCILFSTLFFITGVSVLGYLNRTYAGAYYRVAPIAPYDDRLLPSPMKLSMSGNHSEYMDDEAGLSPLENLSDLRTMKLIHSWEHRPDKPYLKDNVMLADVAQQLDISVTQLSYTLNHVMNVNFSTWINQLRIETAKSLLAASPNRSVSEIAYESGYSNLQLFSRNFKRLTGLSPTEYRESCGVCAPA